jgi:two-component system LytT family sensor kinase
MKIFKAVKVLNQEKPLLHLCILVFSVLVVVINLLLNPATKSWNNALSGFILIFSQVELFIFLAQLIFRNLKEGRTPGEVSRIVLSRFAVFIIACFAGAFVIMIIFLYGQQILKGGELSGVIDNFFLHSFRGWLKTTVGGLSAGGVIFIFVLWQDALKSEQKFREESLIFQNETLKNQINPHFLFNSLNTLSSLISTRPETAERFISRLSSIYRYILENSQKNKVPLQSELAFISDYFDLHRVRDEEKITLKVDAPDADKYSILPVSLQILIENAIKHNKATRENPLEISIFIEGHMIVVKNNLQRMATQIRSTGIGLKNLSERVRLISGKEMIIDEISGYFIVKLPLL